MAKDSYLYQCKKVIDFQIVTSIWGRQFVDCWCDVLHNKWSKHLNQHPHANHLMSLWLFILYQLENATCLNHHSFKQAYYLSNQPNNATFFFFFWEFTLVLLGEFERPWRLFQRARVYCISFQFSNFNHQRIS